MRTTIDLPEDLFREAKTRAVQQGTTLKNLMTQFIQSGLAVQEPSSKLLVRRMPPPEQVSITQAADREASALNLVMQNRC